MTEGNDAANRFLPRIRQELDKLPLSEEEKDAVTPKLLKHSRFFDTDGGRNGSGRLTVDSPFFDFAEKLHTAVAAFHKDGLTLDKYLGAALKNPVLFYSSPDTTLRNFEAALRFFEPDGLTRHDYFKAALKQPQLFNMLPETIEGNITGVVEQLQADGLTRRDYFKAALKEPELFVSSPNTLAQNVRQMVSRFSADGLTTQQYLKAAIHRAPLFYQSPDTLERNIRGVVDLFTADGLTTRQYLKAALRQPSNFTQSPETLAENIIGLVELFKPEGLSVPDYLQAALKQPSLFAMSPGTVASHITGVVEQFKADGLTTREYLRAALKNPLLFTSSPDTVGRHINAVLGFSDSGIFTPPVPFRRTQSRARASQNPRHAAVIDFLLTNPALMSLADDNFGVREVNQRLANSPTDSRLLQQPRYAVERDLMLHLGHKDPEQPVSTDKFVAGVGPPTEEQAKRFVLRALMHAGFIKGGSMER